MKNRDYFSEMFSDVKNVDADIPLFAGNFVPVDMALFYPGGKIF